MASGRQSADLHNPAPKFSVAINGTRVGCFATRDLLSLYLFFIAMEVFMKLLAKMTMEKKTFEFHLRCSKLYITHLCFVDDMLLFLATKM